MTAIKPGSLMLAPMVELSHRPLRELVAGFGGCDRYYSEMTSAAGYLAGSPFDAWFLDPLPCPEQTVLQLYSPDAERMALATQRLVRERQAEGVAVGGVEANFGCSAPQIERIGGGVKWMKDPAGAATLIRGMRQAAPDTLVSAKMRLGYEESFDALKDFCAGLVEAGADYLVLHPRLSSEKFRRTGRWDYVRRLAAAMPVPVIGNGDIRDFRAYNAAMQDHAPGGIMIGREAVRRPWIFALIRGQQLDPGFSMQVDLEETGLHMISMIRTLLPKNFHLSRSRRFFFYYCDNLKFGHHIRFAIQNAPDLDAVEALFRGYFAEAPGERIKTDS
ncbi:MAG: tRNA dihydrouridine synthase [Clostridia bacterium]